MAAGDKKDEPVKIAFGGVPEHFNMPFKEAIKRGEFLAQGTDVSWEDIPGGTGAMMAKLRDGEVDVAVALTDGIISAISKSDDLEFVIVGPYVASPLNWAIVSGANRGDVDSVGAAGAFPIAVSRLGSGSHLMAFLLAEREGWDTSKLSFEAKGNFESLRGAVNEAGGCGMFMWEHFMTKPYWLKGELKHLGDIATPWPAFLMVARRSWLQGEEGSIRADALRRASGVIRRSAHRFVSHPETAAKEITEMYGIAPEDAKAWLGTVQFTGDPAISQTTLQNTIDILKRTKVLEKDLTPKDIVDHRIVALISDDEDAIPAFAVPSSYRESGKTETPSAEIVTASGQRFDDEKTYLEWRTEKAAALKRVLEHLETFHGVKTS